MGKWWGTDTFTNFISGLGLMGRDKSVSGVYTFNQLDQQQVINAYRGDWITRKAIDIPPFDATRQWRNWQADDDQIEQLEKAEKKLKVQQKLQQALTKARLFGGACIIIGVDQGTMDQPLDVEKVGKDSLKYLHTVTRWGINPSGVRITDMTSPWFGEPEWYERKNSMPNDTLSIQNVRIHPSRVIRLNGLDQPDEDRAMEIWGDSVLQLINDSIQQCSTVAGSVAAMVAEAKVDVIKIPKLTEILSTKAGTNTLLARFANSNVSKSVINSVLIDSEEELTRLETMWRGIPEVLQMYMLLVCGAVDIPATRFLGQSPVGMNATGESDTRNYYDRLKADQSTRTTPALTPLDEILIRHVFGSRDESIYYEWAPLWQMTEAEKAAIAYNKAQTVQIDVNTTLVPESALAKGRQNQLIEDGFYPGLEKAIEEADAAGEFSPHDPEQQVEASEEEKLAAQEQQQQQLELAHKAIEVKAKSPGGAAKVMPFKAKKKDAAAKTKDTDIADATPKTLYVRRDLINVDEFTSWATEQGFTDIVDDPHVTILYSKEEVDWIKMGSDMEFSSSDDATLTIAPGGPRVVEPLGVDGAVVLLFSASRLCWRHEEMVRRGASHDYDEYVPHVTITYNGRGVDLTKVEPYRGTLEFGPEIFEDIKQPGPDDETEA